MKNKLLVILILFNLQSVFAQFNDNDYTNMFEMSGSITDQDGFSLDLSYSWIYYMGIWGNFALRPEMVMYSDGAFQGINKFGTAIWYGYDFGNKYVHAFPYSGIAFNFLLGAGSESGF
ncbi:hypothetical protein AGMMS49579_02720 [Spirochaetia bacterium]|nr:hypothetical protein AGMMS49579_02720 [Spirochaetia bacterium]